VKNKKKFALLGAVGVCAGLLIAYYVHMSAAKDLAEAANATGVINPSVEKGLATQPVPQLTERTFTPAPSAITGSYTDPAEQEDANMKSSAKNTSAAKNSRE
jgi:hypothetical protein